LNLEDQFNSILINEIDKIPDPKVKKICELALKSSKDGFERGESPVEDFVSNQIDKQLTKIVGN